MMSNTADKAQYFLVSGRWDNTVIVIDLKKALDPANDATDNAVINRLRVTSDIKTAGGWTVPASGQPIYVTIHQELKRAYVTNHSGNADACDTGSAELGWDRTPLSSISQHGYRGTIAVVNLEKALDPANWNTLGAVEEIFDSGGYGPTGTAISPDGKYLALAHAESERSEDGGYHISIIDLATNKIIHRVQQALANTAAAPDLPRFAPHPDFGYYPCPNGLCFSPVGNDKVADTLFTANGGTLDVSVISWARAMAKDPGAELGRIPTQSGGFGISASPCGNYIAATSREDPRDNSEGNTISIIDVKKALTDPANAEINRILVGTNDPKEATRPFAVGFTRDGSRIVVTCFRSNNISIIDTADAISGRTTTAKHIILEMPNGAADGLDSRPRFMAFSADGAYVAISGAPPKGLPNSGVVWILDTKDWTVKGRVTGVGNEAYSLAGFTGAF